MTSSVGLSKVVIDSKLALLPDQTNLPDPTTDTRAGSATEAENEARRPAHTAYRIIPHRQWRRKEMSQPGPGAIAASCLPTP